MAARGRGDGEALPGAVEARPAPPIPRPVRHGGSKGLSGRSITKGSLSNGRASEGGLSDSVIGRDDARRGGVVDHKHAAGPGKGGVGAGYDPARVPPRRSH